MRGKKSKAKKIALDFLETEYVHRMHEYDKEIATKDLIVLLSKLGIKSAQGSASGFDYIATYDILVEDEQ